MKKLELFYPLKPIHFGQGFGENKVPIYTPLGMLGHNGIDFPCEEGTPVYAAHDGFVTYAGMEKKEGMGVVIRTKEQYDYNGEPTYFKTIYWHNQYPDGIKVRMGQEIKVGDLISLTDTTGLAFGPHLHFGLKPILKGENDWTWANIEQNNGYFGAIDPKPYFNGYFAKDAQTVLQILQQQISVLSRVAEIYKKLLGI